MPAIATIDETKIHLVGDVHGGGARVAQLFRAARWDSGSGVPVPPPGSLLLQVGDLIDRGKQMARHRRTGRLSNVPLPERVAQITGGTASRVMVPAPERLGVPPVSLLALATGEVSWPRAMVEHQQQLLSHACDSVETLRFFIQLETHARAEGARVLCLVGNHEADLIRGRFRHARKQKFYLLALLGVPLEVIRVHGSRGLSPFELAKLGVPELSWLLELPVMAVGQGILAVHGGPCERLVSAMQTLGVQDLRGLEAVFQEARDAGFEHPLTEEGASVLSPGREEDDMFRRPVLLHTLLEVAGAEILAVGHSPFLHFPRGQWVDIDDPEVRKHLERPAFLGCHGEVLKLDTDMKRGGPAWMVSRDSGAGRWTALREDGFHMVLEPDAHSRHGPRFEAAAVGSRDEPSAQVQATLSWPLEGVDGGALERVYGALEDLQAAGERAIADRVQQHLVFLLHAGIADLAPILHGLRWRGPRLAQWATWFDTWFDEVVARYGAWQAELEALTRGTREEVVLFLKPPDACRVGGQWVQMLPAVALEVAGALQADQRGTSPSHIVTTSYVSVHGEPYVRVHRFGQRGREISMTAVPVSHPRLSLSEVTRIVARTLEQAPESRSANSPGPAAGSKPVSPPKHRSHRVKLQAAQPVADTSARRCLEAWVHAVGAPAPPERWACFVARDGHGRVVADRYLVDLGDGLRIPIVHLPDGAWIPANVTFGDPKRRYPVILSNGAPPEVADVDHAHWLLRYLDSDPVRLYSAVSPEVAALLYQADVDAIGLPDPRRPVWQRGRYLFLSPQEDIGTYFYNKSVMVRFVLKRSQIASAVSAGLMTANLFLADGGEVLEPDARFGAADIGLELVAVGSDGIAWLLDYMIR